MPMTVNQMDPVPQMANSESVAGGPHSACAPRNRRQHVCARRRTPGPNLEQDLRRPDEAVRLGFGAAVFQNSLQHLRGLTARHFPGSVPSGYALHEECLQSVSCQPLSVGHGASDHGRRKKRTARRAHVGVAPGHYVVLAVLEISHVGLGAVAARVPRRLCESSSG